MDDGLTDLLHRVVAIFGELARERLAADAAELTYTQMRIIGSLEEGPAATQHQLADALGLSEAATSRALRVLQNAGLVDIVTDPSHGRRRLVSATPAGLKIFHVTGMAMATQLRDWLIQNEFPYERYLNDSRLLAELLVPLTRKAPSRNLAQEQ